MYKVESLLLGKSVGAIASGQLIAHAGMSIPDLFMAEAGFNFVGSSIVFVVYRVFGVKLEANLKAKLAQDGEHPNQKFVTKF